MCGLVGVAGFIDDTVTDIFRHLHIFDIVRGDDSSGIFTIKTDNGINWVKNVGWPDSLRDHTMFDYKGKVKVPKVGDPQLCVIAGHNRAATSGKITADNAHPFAFDNIVGMHNGTLEKFSMYPFKDFNKHDVDSQILFSEIDTDNDFRDIYKKTVGAMALVWFDKRNESLNIIRNKERPLYYTFLNEGRTFVWASESWMILAACGRAGVKHKFEVKGLKENTWIRMYPTKREVNKPIPQDDWELIDEFGVNSYTSSYTPNNYRYQGWPNYGNLYDYKGQVEKKVTPLLPKDKKEEDGDIYPFFYNLKLTKKEMEEKLSKSCPCVWCDKEASINEAKELIWFSSSQYICGECQTIPAAISHLPYSVMG